MTLKRRLERLEVVVGELGPAADGDVDPVLAAALAGLPVGELVALAMWIEGDPECDRALADAALARLAAGGVNLGEGSTNGP